MVRDDMYRYGVVAIGYKNVNGIIRLLNLLSIAEYDSENVTLIISIDKSDDDEILKIADKFQWSHGEKYVNTFTKRLGLREHVLHCGDYLNQYDLDALAVFEDDIIPSWNFFRFMRAATERYIEEENIAGVSLYTHCINFNTQERFVPVTTDGDVYFIQCAQSRGQVWFKNQWNDFRLWYQKQDKIEDSDLVPRSVSAWPETSWLKYHIKYCIAKNKYFVYPYISYSTCFGEVGEHVKVQRDDLQVPLSNIHSKTFHFRDFDKDALKYDAFFENQNLYKYCNINKKDLLVDLYGMHTATNKKYILTKKKMPYQLVRSWENKLIPHELNVMYDLVGDGIYLYDLKSSGEMVKIFNKEKMERYFDILDHWMEIEEQGKTLESYFLKRHWQHIAIYGYGKLGKHLFNRLKDTLIHVDYFIDQDKAINIKNVEIRGPEDELPAVDVIVVTPIVDYIEIKKLLHKKQGYQIVSIEDIFE